MTELAESFAFRLHIYAAGFTVVKLVSLALATVGVRTKSNEKILPEDSKLFKSELVSADSEGRDRCAAICFGVIVGARLLRSIGCALKLRPFRSLISAIGAFCLIDPAASSAGLAAT
jgi:hypothetical protein